MSTQNDLQDSNQALVAITEPPPDIRTILERTACLVSRKGLKMERRIMDSNQKNSRFNFLRSSDPCHAFYQKKLTEYRARNQDGAQDIQPDTPAPTHERVGGRRAPLFTFPPKPLTPYCFTFIQPPEGITLNELGIIKLTAQFVARYGMYFLADLMKRENKNPQFEFMKETDSRCEYFTKLVVAYSRVLLPSKKLSKRRACMETVLKGFFEHLRLEKLEEGLEAFVGGVDYFAHMEVKESCANVGIPVTLFLGPNGQLQPPSVDVSSLVIDDLFPANHPQKLSSSGQNDLQSGPNISKQAPADVTIIEPPPSIRSKVERTALLVSQEGLEIERRIRDCNVGNKKFNFLRSSDPFHAFYQMKLTEYRARNQDGAAQPDTPASPFRGPMQLKPVKIKPPEGITVKELGIMKFTAQFEARYGIYFWTELEKRVSGNRQFEFIEEKEEDDARSIFYDELVAAYSRVLMRSEKLSERGACMDTLLKGFFKHLQLEKQEEGDEMAMRDVQAFVGVVDYFAHMEEEPEEPEPKRQKLDEF